MIYSGVRHEKAEWSGAQCEKKRIKDKTLKNTIKKMTNRTFSIIILITTLPLEFNLDVGD